VKIFHRYLQWSPFLAPIFENQEHCYHFLKGVYYSYTDSPHYWKDPAYQKKMAELETKRHEEQLLRELNCFHTPGCIPM